MKEEIENNNNLVESKDREIKQLQEELAQQIEFYKETIKELTQNVLSIKEEMGKLDSSPLKVHEEQLEKQKKLIDQKDQQISEIKNEINICDKKLKGEEKPDYSDPFGDDPVIHKIKPDQEDSFDVLCDSATAVPGWTVIQQKINNMMNFYRD
ncbi:angiopoietin-related protein 7-like [Drosophila novamexicana]|uniref:angiopoietin-related protein 7-like n=1 Tax=Drosophila novamexicana TaxID=47314 RepID=UPI0011E599ED|nr:angiopoietin-related protein 7-like [Drosophila novamexicana]